MRMLPLLIRAVLCLASTLDMPNKLTTLPPVAVF
jgi:hypothetical protein